MIIDAHCHAWPRWPYRRDAGAAPIDEAMHGSIERLRAAMTVAGVTHAMLVAADIGDPVIDDNDYAARGAASAPELFSFVSDVDSRWSATHHDGRMGVRIAALPDDDSRLGIGHYLADAADSWWESREADHVGRILAERRMLLSLHAPPPWHAAVGEWAGRHPEVPVLLHHLGLVQNRRDLSALVRLADVPSIHVKASGFGYVDPDGASSGHPFARTALKEVVASFGAERVAWGSDFPVSPERGIDYDRALGDVSDVVGAFGDAALAVVLGGTAARLLGRDQG